MLTSCLPSKCFGLLAVVFIELGSSLTAVPPRTHLYHRPEKLCPPAGLQELAGHKTWPSVQGLIAPHTATWTQNIEELQLPWDEQVSHQVLLDDFQESCMRFLVKILNSGKLHYVRGVETLF